MSSGISVSLCMITRNEEHCITRCISSVRHLVEEIIVVDTGSSDDTKAVAADNGAKVLEFDWCDDFAAARNYALEQAASDWILVLDADETLGSVTRDEFLAVVTGSLTEGYYLKICSYLNQGDETAADYIVRLFKNKPQYRFNGVIHEQVAGSIKYHNGGGGLAFAPLTVYHFGYLTEAVLSKQKFLRNTTIINKALLDSPQDSFLHYCLGVEHLQSDVKLANELLLKALALMSGEEGYFRQVLIALLMGLLLDPSWGNPDDIFAKAFRMFPDDGDIYCLYGIRLLQYNRYEEALVSFTTAMAKRTEILAGSQIYNLLGDACYLTGNYPFAQEHYIAAWKLAPHELYPFIRILDMWKSKKGQVAWDTLSSIISAEHKTAICNYYLRRADIVIIFALLSILGGVKDGDDDKLAEACHNYRITVEGWDANTPIDTVVKGYILIGASEICGYAQALKRSLDCEFWNAKEELYKHVMQALNLVILVIEEIGPCESALPDEGVANNAVYFNR